MSGLITGLFVLGSMAGIAAVFHLIVRDEFGERTAANLRRMGRESAAQKWTQDRGRRASLIAARIWGTVAALVLTAGIVTWVVAR